MKKILTALALTAFTLTPLATAAPTQAVDQTVTLGGMQIPNPWTDFSSLKAASEATGINLKAPNKYLYYKVRDYRGITTGDNQTIELIYTSTQGKNDYADTLRLRKAPGNSDISGDFVNYDFTKELTIGKLKVTTKGNGSYIHLATWQRDGFSYSLSIDGGLSEAELTKLVKKIR